MEKEMKVCFSAGVKYKNLYFLSAIYINALFMYDEKKEKLTFITNFKKEKKKENLYLKAFLYKKEAWFIPRQADFIAIVNLENYNIKYMPLIYQNYLYESFKYINILHFKEDYLCLIPNCVDAAMIIDLKNKKAKAYNNIITSKRNYSSAIFLNEKIYFFPLTEKNILALDLKTDERIKLPWKEQEEAFGEAYYDEKSGKIFHAPLRENDVLIDDLCIQKKEKKNFTDWKDKKYRTYYSCGREKEIFFWGHEKGIILKIDKNDYKTKIYPVNHSSKGMCFFPISSSDIEALISSENCIIKYNAEKDIFIKKYISTTFNNLEKEIKQAGIKVTDIIKNFNETPSEENITLGLQQFIFLLLRKKEERRINQSEINSGYKIYKITK